MDHTESTSILERLNTAFVNNKPYDSDKDIIKNSFQKELHHILEDISRRFCKPKINPDYDEDHNLCVSELFDEFELFICNGRALSNVIDELETQGASVIVSSVCGHIFKAREPTYTCEDCAMDPTCVFCRACFLQSSHVKHNYRMHSSGGGGYCDCGDVEAWHKDPWCKKHLAAKERNEKQQSGGTGEPVNPESHDKMVEDEEKSETERLNQIPPDMKERIDILMEFLLEWVTNLILYRMKATLPACFNVENEDSSVCVLFNDELHSFDQVIRALTKYIPDCNKQAATNFATIVDRDGRSVIYFGNEAVTNDIADKIQELTRRQTGTPLRCKSIQSHLISVQNLSLHILQWFVDLVSKLEILRPVVCHWIFRLLPVWENVRAFSVGSGSFTILERMLISHAKLWKGARRVMMNCFMGVILKDGYYKKKFAELYTLHYGDITSAYAEDDHHDIDSLKLVTCQIYTVMSVARQLLESHNILRSIIDTVLDEVHNHLKPLDFCPTEHVINYSQPGRSKFDKFQRYFDSFMDLKYILLNLKNDPSWCRSQSAKNHYLDYFSGLVLLLRYIQDMNLMKRSATVHVEEEPEWTSGFFVSMSICKVLHLSAIVAGADPDLLHDSFMILWDTFLTRIMEHDKQYLTTTKAFNNSWPIVNLNVSVAPVTVIQPLPRMIAAFYAGGLQFNFTWSHYKINKDDDLIILLERPLQVLVYCSQVSRNHWVRNGIATQNIISNLFRPNFRTEMVDRDFQLVQQIASKLPADKFLVCVLNKFNLQDYFIKDSLGDKSDSVRFLAQSAEDFFRLLLVTVAERHRICVGDRITPQDVLKREIVHQLCCKPKIHSELIETLKDGGVDRIELIFMEVIDCVADRVNIGQKTFFKVKNDYLQHYSPFFYHYTQTDKNSSEQWVRKRLKELNLDDVLPPPIPVQFSENFSPVNEILRCDVFFHLIHTTLKFVFTKQNRCTETTLEIILHLIGIALHEDWRSSNSPNPCFPFLEAVDRFEAAQKPGDKKKLFDCLKTESKNRVTILDHLEQLPGVVDEEHVALVKWTVNKWLSVKLFRAQNNLQTLSKSPDSAETADPISRPASSAAAAVVVGQEEPMDVTVAKPEDKEKKKRDEAVKARRAKVMAKMSQMQKKFIEKNVNLTTESKEGAPAAASSEVPMELSTPSLDTATNLVNKVVGCGRIVKRNPSETLICILCQEDVEEDLCGRAMIIAASGIQSAVMKWPLDTQPPQSHSESVSGAAAASEPAADRQHRDRPLIAKRDHPEGTFLAVCGHVMHLDCKKRYFQEMRNKVPGFHSYLPETDCRCPLCKCLSSLNLIILPPLNEVLPNDQLISQLGVDLSFDKWLSALTRWFTTNNQQFTSTRLTSEFHHSTLDLPELSSLYNQPPTDIYGASVSLSGVEEGKSTALIELPKDLSKVNRSPPVDVDSHSLVDHRNLRHSLAYTLTVWQKSLSLSGSSFFNGLPERYSNGLTYVIRACLMAHSSTETLTSQDPNQKLIRNDALKLLSVLFPENFTNSSREADEMDVTTENAENEENLESSPTLESDASILEVDCFFLLVSLIMMRPVIFSTEEDFKRFAAYSSPLSGLSRLPCGDVVEQHCVRLCTAALVVQTILLAQPDDLSSWRGIPTGGGHDSGLLQRSLSEEETILESEELVELYQHLRLASGINESFVPSPRALAHYLRDALLPYLRCSAYFLHNISQVDPPTPLVKDASLSIEHEVSLLMRYLDIPLNICELLEQSGETLKQLFALWCLDKRVETQLNIITTNINMKKERMRLIESQFSASNEPMRDTLSMSIARGPQRARLIDLPHDFTDLLAKAVEYTCSGCDASRYPAFCLICGEFACYQGYCCLVLEGPRNTNVYGAQIHARKCHSGYTVMLSLQKCKLLIYSDEARRVNSYPAPYKDRYGETDQGLRRGQPLYLDREEYRKINEQWLNHSLAHLANSAITDVLWE